MHWESPVRGGGGRGWGEVGARLAQTGTEKSILLPGVCGLSKDKTATKGPTV